VVGIDPSLNGTGLCWADGTASTVACRTAQGDRRLTIINSRVAKVAAGVDLAVVELAPPGLRGASIAALHMVQCAVRMALLDREVPYALVHPSWVKAYAAGNGGSATGKPAMAAAAYERTGQTFADDNQCDAFWLRQMGLDWYGEAELIMPASQRAWLERVKWPKIGTRAEAAR
jgi:hypothetical protein